MSSGKPIAALLAVVCLAQCSRHTDDTQRKGDAPDPAPAIRASEQAPTVAVGLPEIDPSLPTQERIAVALRSVQQGLDEILEACGVDAEVALSADGLKASPSSSVRGRSAPFSGVVKPESRANGRFSAVRSSGPVVV